jgi:hypothetical protein
MPVVLGMDHMPAEGDGDVAAVGIAVVHRFRMEVMMRVMRRGGVFVVVGAVLVPFAWMMSRVLGLRGGGCQKSNQAQRTDRKKFRDIHMVPFQRELNACRGPVSSVSRPFRR